MATKSVIQLDAEAAKAVRHALHIGLQSLGIIQELESAAEVAKVTGHPWPDDAHPVHPTGSADTVSIFANALRYMEG